jgi:hypothetical protein
MSHELRTPMNGVLGVLNLLLDSSLSKLDAGKLDIESISFNPIYLLESVGDNFSMSGQTKQLTVLAHIAPDIPYHLIGDPLRIQQIVTNLLSNTIKFTDKGGVHLFSIYKKGMWKISIEDTGMGMSDEQQRGIFEEFTQADLSTTRNYGGTGLGLSICQKLLNLMNGSIKLSSKIGHGSTFKIDTPILADPAEIKPEQSFSKRLYEVVIINQNVLESDFIQACLTHWHVEDVHKFSCFISFESQANQLCLNKNVLFIVSVEIYKLLSEVERGVFNHQFILLANNDHNYLHLPHVSLPVKQSELFDHIANIIG